MTVFVFIQKLWTAKEGTYSRLLHPLHSFSFLLQTARIIKKNLINLTDQIPREWSAHHCCLEEVTICWKVLYSSKVPFFYYQESKVPQGLPSLNRPYHFSLSPVFSYNYPEGSESQDLDRRSGTICGKWKGPCSSQLSILVNFGRKPSWW